MLTTLNDLFQALNQQNVRYCHWKSNVRLSEALDGGTDLDLLVDRKHSQLFRKILNEHNVKPTVAAPGKHYPAIENYLGFDAVSGKLFHLHVHYRLVLGEQFVKNYHLPLESHFLDAVQLRSGVKIPVPEWEIIVLSMRALLKYRDRDALKDILVIRSPGMPAKIRKEIEWLLGQTSMAHISRTLGKVPGVVPQDIVLAFLQTMMTTPRSGYQLYRLRNRLRGVLRPFQRYNRLQAATKYFLYMIRRKSILKYLLRRKMTLFNGGMAIAFVGIDGAGKSTVIKHMIAWLSWRLNVRCYYMGSAQPSLSTRILKYVSKLARSCYHRGRRLIGEKCVVTRLVQGSSQFLINLRYIGEAKDRYKRYRLGQRKAAAGFIVIYDRFPLEAIRIYDRAMDGPRIGEMSDGHVGGITTKLRHTEERIYQKIPPVEHLFVLHINPEVSLARKLNQQPEKIKAKSQAIEQITRDNIALTDIDAEEPLDQVLLQVKSKLWCLL